MVRRKRQAAFTESIGHDDETGTNMQHLKLQRSKRDTQSLDSGLSSDDETGHVEQAGGSIFMIIGIIVGCLVLIAVVVAIIVARRRGDTRGRYIGAKMVATGGNGAAATIISDEGYNGSESSEV